MGKPNVLVTGFGPFGEHKINASWEAVKLLPEYDLQGINLFIEEIEVAYTTVERKVPLLWKEINPTLVIHVGVSSYTHKLQIEKQAHRTGYTRFDCLQQTLTSGNVCCATKGEDCIETCLDLEKIIERVKDRTKIEIIKSENAGRYLCEFTYYTSLNIDSRRTLFVHVPVLEKP